MFRTSRGVASITAALLVGTVAGCSGSDPFADREGEFGKDSAAVGGVCPAGDTVEGIDVSIYQGNVNWAKVLASGRKFAFVRLSDGLSTDSNFSRNWDGAKQAGLIRGVYQFFRSTHTGAQQAQLLLQHVSSFGPGDLPPVLDVEQANGASASTIAAQVQDWVKTVQDATGVQPIIYTGQYFWNDNVSSSAESNLPLWIAQYGPRCPTLPHAWSGWSFFQYSEKGSVPGISGNVDLDRFNGSFSDLQALANGGGGQAQPMCTTDSDCNNGQTGTQQVCGNDGNCISGCHQDSDCASGNVCSKSGSTWTCVTAPPPKPMCSSDADCNNGQSGTQRVCGNDGNCITGCHEDSDCPSGKTCNTSGSTWTCVTQTNTGGNGDTDGGTGGNTGGNCNCDSGQVCCSDTCTDPTTDNDNCGSCGHACTNGQSCQDSVCTGGNTDNGGSCSTCKCNDGSCSDESGACSDGSNCLYQDANACTVCQCSDGTCSDDSGNCGDGSNCNGSPDFCSVCTCSDGSCPTDASGSCSDGSNCSQSNTCDVCQCSDGSCADGWGNCSDGSNCSQNSNTCTTCTCSDGSCSDDTGACSDGSNCLYQDANACTVCTCSDNSCSDDQGNCSDGSNCMDQSGNNGGSCDVCTCDDGSCPVDSSGACSDGYNCLSQDYCGVCICSDGTCATDSLGTCSDGSNCSTQWTKHKKPTKRHHR